MNGKELIVQFGKDWKWFEDMKFTNWKYLKNVKQFVCGKLGINPLDKSKPTIIKNSLDKTNNNNDTNTLEKPIKTTNNNKKISKKKPLKNNNKKKNNKKKNYNNNKEQFLVESSDYETIDWSEKPVLLFKEINKYDTSLETLNLDTLDMQFENWYNKLNKHYKKGFNKLVAAFARYLVDDMRTKYKSYPKYAIGEADTLGIKSNWDFKVANGFNKIMKFYLSCNIGDIFMSKKAYIGGPFNAMKFKFSRTPVSLEHINLSSIGGYFVKKYQELFELHLEEKENYTESDEETFGIKFDIKKTKDKTLEKIKKEKKEILLDKLTAEQKECGWKEIPIPKDKFDATFLKEIWMKRDDKAKSMGAFVFNIYGTIKPIYYWNGKQFIISDPLDQTIVKII